MEGKTKNDLSYAKALGLVWEIVLSVLVTTILFAFGGRWLDLRYGTDWIFTTIGFVLLILVGTRLILKKGERVARLLDGKSNKDGPTSATP